MADHNLEALLFCIRDGGATAGDLVRARELVAADTRLPDELRSVVDFDDDPIGDAVGLLAVLGADSLFGDVLREGLALEMESPAVIPGAQADENSPVTAEMVDGPWEYGLLLGEAVAYEGGTTDVVFDVLSTLELEVDTLNLAEAVRFEAGEVELAGSVLTALGLEEAWVPLAKALRAEAGTVELSDAVLSAVGGMERLPLAAAVRATGGDIEIADAVLQTLGLEAFELPVAAAIRGEAGVVDVVESVASTVADVRIPLAEAIRAEAGMVDVWPEIETVVSDAWVSALLDHELSAGAHRAAVMRLQSEPEAGALMTEFASLGRDLRTAVRAEAGDCAYLWGSVAAEIGVAAEHVEGWDGVQFAAAVRAESGTVDVAASVMESLAAARRPTTLPFAAVEVEAVPAAANNRRFLTQAGAMLMAMVVLVMFGVMQMGGGESNVAVPSADPVTQFASADEVRVEELNFGDHSSGMEWKDENGPLILWVNEEATL